MYVYVCIGCEALLDERKKEIERDRVRPKKETESESEGGGERWGQRPKRSNQIRNNIVIDCDKHGNEQLPRKANE